jgi:hypothetical protein
MSENMGESCLSITYLSIHKKELDGMMANYVNLNHLYEEIGIPSIR